MKRYFTPTNVMADMKEYQSPLDGSVVRSRKHHRDHMKRHDVIEVGNERIKPGLKKDYNPGNIRGDIQGAINDLKRVS